MHLRYLGVEKDPTALTRDVVSSIATGGINQGGNDPYMTSEWDKIEVPAPVGQGSQWLLSETGNEWHAWGLVITPEMIASPDEK